MEDLNEAHRSEGGRHTNSINHTNHQEFCLHMTKANISLPIPLHITPSFKSEYGTCSNKHFYQVLMTEAVLAIDGKFDLQPCSCWLLAVLWRPLALEITASEAWSMGNAQSFRNNI